MAIHESRWTTYWSRHILMNNLCCTRRLNQLPLSCSLCPSSGLFAWIKAWWLAGGVDIVDILRPCALTSKGLSSIVHLTNPSLKCSLFLGPKLATSILFVPPRHLQMVRTGLHAEELLAVSRGGSGDAARHACRAVVCGGAAEGPDKLLRASGPGRIIKLQFNFILI